MAHLDIDHLIGPAAGPAAHSVAGAVIALVAADRSARGRPARAPDPAVGRARRGGEIDREDRDPPPDTEGAPARGPSPASRRLPTGLY